MVKNDNGGNSFHMVREGVRGGRDGMRGRGGGEGKGRVTLIRLRRERETERGGGSQQVGMLSPV